MKYLDLLLTHAEALAARKDIIIGDESSGIVYGVKFACGHKIHFDEPRKITKGFSLEFALLDKSAGGI